MGRIFLSVLMKHVNGYRRKATRRGVPAGGGRARGSYAQCCQRARPESDGFSQVSRSSGGGSRGPETKSTSTALGSSKQARGPPGVWERRGGRSRNSRVSHLSFGQGLSFQLAFWATWHTPTLPPPNRWMVVGWVTWDEGDGTINY